MNGFYFTGETLLLLLPLAAIQLGLAAYCALRIYREGTETLSRWAWLTICLFVQLIGPIAFLIAGRKKEYR